MKVIVTGACHQDGIGFNIAKNLLGKGNEVIITSRNKEEGKLAHSTLLKIGKKVHWHLLDITDQSSIEEFYKFIESKFEKVDVLVNNAGVLLSERNFKTALNVIDVNFRGTYKLTTSILGLIKKNGKIVNISSQLGCCGGMNELLRNEFLNLKSYEHGDELVGKFLDIIKKDGDVSDYGGWGIYLSYSVSKLALNGLAIYLSKEIPQIVVSCCPGWCRTKMGGNSAIHSPEEGSDTPTWLVEKANKSFSGKFFSNREIVSFS